MVKNTTFISFLIVFLCGIIIIYIFPYYTINPGVLIEDHMSLKNDCLSCHSLGEGPQTEKCIACHQLLSIGLTLVSGNERNYINNKSNLLHQSIINIQCFNCHTEHNGLSRKNATLKFEHIMLTTELQTQCIKCHSPQKPDDKIHSMVKAECSDCHSNDKWIPSHFKHDLLAELKDNCRNCHENQQPADEIHKGLGGANQCYQCHTTTEWTPSTFNHTKYFRFDNNHSSECINCHNINKTFETYTCYNCHEHRPERIAQKHLKEGIQNFSNCVECHRSGDEKEAKRIFRKKEKDEFD